MTALENLFPEVSPLNLGGLPNEEELAKTCPPEFKRKNPWSDYAIKAFFDGASISNWQWKSDDPAVQKRQRDCFSAILGGFIAQEKKEAIAGWMLSEMLTEVPEYIPRHQTTSTHPSNH